MTTALQNIERAKGAARVNRLLARLFGCRHKHLTFPLTVKKRTWRTCLDCGAEVIYDWERMTMTQDESMGIS